MKVKYAGNARNMGMTVTPIAIMADGPPLKVAMVGVAQIAPPMFFPTDSASAARNPIAVAFFFMIY